VRKKLPKLKKRAYPETGTRDISSFCSRLRRLRIKRGRINGTSKIRLRSGDLFALKKRASNKQYKKLSAPERDAMIIKLCRAR